MKNPAEIVQGPYLIGVFFNIFLFGVMVAQVYMYFTKYPSDRRWMKIFVLVLLAIDTVNTVVNCVYIYQALVQHFGDIPYLGAAPRALVSEPIITTVVPELMVQIFYAWRVRTLTRSWIIASSVIALSLAGAESSKAGGIAAVIKFDINPLAREFVNMIDLKPIIITWLLLRRRHKNESRKTDMLIDRIIRLTMQTNVLTAVVAIVDTIVYLADPDGTHFVFNLNLSHLYSNSLMSSLNARPTTSSSQAHQLEISTFDAGIPSSEGLSTHLDSTPSSHHTKTSGRSDATLHPQIFVNIESRKDHNSMESREKTTRDETF
ncbi:hypothetical protein D9756_005179 [Leucocoprinus leucothites]|uniref:DUF6534 domain-containing protein n=1 Tax=Leucocoprinus leucothites TaxID=201217 RepID=A0A8H5G954_9AGAR|nr:hypothetical protein D9756_005179 [Leucoagaricus leucothites]